ncbi:MAG: GatB/YqeY domain-containing protein [Candidatus Jorgensenbacteria bacterium]|nr:GatB/YqeY domain-containing protein [Candidatus Jorgensenbacteria bacterium]
MTLHERILEDANRAVKGVDIMRRDTLRFLLSSLHNREIEKRSASLKQGEAGGKGEKDNLTDDDVLGVVEREVKKRKEAIDFFEKGNRPAQAAKEKNELAVLESYLPEALSEAELDRLVEEAIRTTGAASPKDMGRVMGEVKKAAKGARIDGAMAGMKVKAKLGA